MASARWPRAASDAALVVGAIALALVVVTANRAPPVGPSARPSTANARREVSRDPLDLDSLRRLGLALDRGGDAAGAEALLGFAGERSWRDTPLEAWLLQRRLAEGDFDTAFDEADALLRRDLEPSLRQKIFALLVAAASYSAPRPALIDCLGEAPWWRLAFLRQLAATGDAASVRRVLLGLRATPAPATAEEVSPYIDSRVAAGDYRRAHDDWLALRPAAGGGLDDEPPPFGWSAASGAGASSSQETGEGGAPVLRVDYDGYAFDELPRRLLVLSPGRYRVTWRERAEGEAAPRLAWQVRCAEGGAPLAASSPPAPGGGWRAAQLIFVVPPAACAGQWLALTADPGERRAAASAFYEMVRVSRIG